MHYIQGASHGGAMSLVKYQIRFVLFVVIAVSSVGFAASQLTFDSKGVPTSLVLAGQSRLSSDVPLSGFSLRQSDGQTIQLQHAVTDGKTLTVSESGGEPRFTLQVDAYERHVSVHMIKIEGVKDRSTSLELRIPSTMDLGVKAFDQLVTCRSRGKLLTCTWRHLWRTDTDGKLGCFGLYDDSVSDSEVDDSLAEMWATEGKMVRPNVSPWDVVTVNKWVDTYALKFGPRSNTMMLVEASNPKELYTLTDVAISQNIKKIYLHCATWRGEYWPKAHSIVHVNRDVFPKGRSDLAAYADYLHERGMILYCHNVSLGIGMYDPDYIVGTVDKRLDAWGKGTLEAGINSSVSTIMFRPEPGAALPLYSDSQVTNKRVTWDYIRIGNEIVKVGSYQDTDKPVWRLTDCSRGIGGTEALSHAAGVDGGGLWAGYNKNFIPPYDVARPDSLLKEMAQKYATLVNEVKLDHIHFDGIEIHSVNPICRETVMDLVYERVNRVVDSSRPGGTATASFELAFKRVSPWTYKAVKIPLRLDEENKGTWLASSRLEAHFSVANCILYGSRDVEVCPPIGGAGLTTTTLNNHGLKEEMFGLLQDWRVLLPKFTPDDFKILKTIISRRPGSNHYQSEDVPVLIKENGEYKIQPHRIMGQADGSDRMTHFIQERGAIARRQYIMAGESLSLVNPYEAQGAGFYIHMLASNETGLINPKIRIGLGSVQVAATVLPGQYLYYDGSSSTAIIYDKSWNRVATPPVTKNAYTMPKGTANVSVTVDASDPKPSLDVQFITKGSKYTLGANKYL